ncbi:MAG TPA: amino acid permease, partial [bacterium]
MKKFETEVRLAREMSLMDATLIGVGAMIGAGIFVLIGIAAGVAGPALLITFALNGCIALLTAMSYAELGSCFHDAGGGYLWVKEGLPKWNGFLSGWMSWFAHAVACSLYALGFGAYFEHVFHEFAITLPQWGFFSPQKLLAAGAALLFAYINFRGASETGKVGNLVTIAKIIILLVFVSFGMELILRKGDWQTTFKPFMPNGWGGVFKAMGLTFIAFQGFEVIAQSSEEIKNPRKNIPRAVFLSLLIVVPIYFLVAISALGSVKPVNMTAWDYLAQQKEIALVEVARHFFTGGGIMILVGGLISTMSALNATIYSSSRVAFAMGRDRNFPSIFSKVHSKNFTPHWGIMVSLVIIILMAVSLPIEDVASAADIMFLLLFLQVNVAMIRLRKKRPDLDRGFKVPLFPYLSILGIILLLFLAIYMFNYSLIAWIVTTVWIIIGLSVYRGYAAGREVEHIRKVKALERIE